MKKKKVFFSPKLFLQKNTIAELNPNKSNWILGGQNTVRDANSTPPCGPCNASLDGGCQSRQWSLCATVDNGQGICCRDMNSLAGAC